MNNLKDFAYFCKLQLATGDYDAHIPFFKQIVKSQKLNKERAIWLGFLYMGYYNEGCALHAYDMTGGSYKKLPPLNLPIETQRRNLYGGRIGKHFTDINQVQHLQDWLYCCDDWKAVLTRVRGLYGNGRWASFTTSELLINMTGMPIEPNYFDVMASSGPKEGLKQLGVSEDEPGAMIVMCQLADEGIKVRVSELESLLCDWAGMIKGTFYAGRNIDRQQGRLVKVEQVLGSDRFLPSMELAFKTRKVVFPSNTLGEVNGWSGIDKKRLKVYRDKGKVLAPEEDR